MEDKKRCKHDNFEIINNSFYICKTCSLLGIIKEKTLTETKIKLFSKPDNYNIYNEINIYEITKNAINYYMNNSELIINPESKTITNLELYLKFRKKLIRHTYNLCRGINTTYECYFLSIILMDNVIKNINYKINDYQLDLINTICFIISKKFNERDFLKVECYDQYLTICHSPQKYINPTDLINMEIECLKVVKYNLNIPTSLTILKYILICGIIFANEINENEIKNIYKKSIDILFFCVEQNEIYLKFNPIQVAFGVIYLIRKKYNLKNNITKYFDELFGIKFSYIKECTKMIEQLYYKETNNNNKKDNINQKNNNIQIDLKKNNNIYININDTKKINKNSYPNQNLIHKKYYHSPIIKTKKLYIPIIINNEFGSATRLSALNLDDLDDENDDKMNIKSFIIVKNDNKKMYKKSSNSQFFRFCKHQ